MAKRRQDPKEDALREARALNPRPDAVIDAGFAASEFLDARDLVQVRYEMVRRVQPSAIALAVYLATVPRSTPRLRATSAFLRPAFQWIRISTTSTTLNVLLVMGAPRLG